MFKDSSAIPFGEWLLIGSGALPPRKTGVAIYISPNARRALVNYQAVSDRIISATFLTKAGLCVVINHHAPEEATPQTEKEAHWDLISKIVSAIPPKKSTKIIIIILEWLDSCNERISISLFANSTLLIEWLSAELP